MISNIWTNTASPTAPAPDVGTLSCPSAIHDEEAGMRTTNRLRSRA
jgi:hypothetical protein